jgi:hypothetical protein
MEMVETSLIDSSVAFIATALVLLATGHALPAMKEIFADPWLAPASDPAKGARAARTSLAASSIGLSALLLWLLWEGMEQLLPLLR